MPVVDEPLRGRFAYLDHPGLLSLSGIEQMTVFLRGELPAPPLHHLTGLRVVEVGPGTAVYEMPASPWWRSAAGVFLGGTFPFVADVALGTALSTTLSGGTWLATSEMSVNYLRPATPAAENLTARARLIQVGRGQGLTEAQVLDGHGRFLAHLTSRLMIRDVPFDPVPAPESFPPVEGAPSDPPDPYLRPSPGRVLPQREWDAQSGLDLCRRWTKGDLPLPPVSELTGLRPVETEEGRVAWAMPASEWFCTAFRSFYGGAVAFLADGAVNGAIISILPAGASYGTLDLKVNFLRPVEPDGRDLVARAEIVHRGRTVVVASAQVEDAAGRRVAMATSSAMLFPRRPWPRDESGSAFDEAPTDEA